MRPLTCSGFCLSACLTFSTGEDPPTTTVSFGAGAVAGGTYVAQVTMKIAKRWRVEDGGWRVEENR